MDYDIDEAIEHLITRPELLARLDRKMKYEVLNYKKRNLSRARKLEALYLTGLIYFEKE